MGKLIKLRAPKKPFKTIRCSNCGGDTWRIIPGESRDGASIQAIICATPGCGVVIKARVPNSAAKIAIITPSPNRDR